jgi:2-aminobenzoate-CoA ligase
MMSSGHVDTFCRDSLPARDQWPELVFDIEDVRYPERLNCVTELLDHVIDRHGPDRPCLRTANGGVMTYADVLREVERTCHVLCDRYGIVPGNRILLRAPNNPRLAVAWLATLRAGAVAVTTMPMLRVGELSTLAGIARINLALCDDRFVDDLRAADLGPAPVVTFDQLAAVSAEQPGTPFPPADTASDDVALLAFTSGTTGRPKATMHFHRDVLAIADTFGRHVVRIEPDDIVTGTPPLGFTFGLGGLLVFPMRAGASTLLLERVTPDELATAIHTHGVTVCFTAPTAYKAMLAAGAAGRLRGLRRGIAAGEHLPRSTWQAFHDATGVRLIDGIGSTEMLHVFISAADDDIHPGATGVEVPGYHATILDADGHPAPVGTPGRLAVKGPTGCRYLADERQRVYVQNGWNLTGDIYVQDKDGYFIFVARGDDMIVSSGYNIAGPEVEEALIGHPAVTECAVVAAPDPARGHIVKAYIVLAAGVTGDDALISELQDFVKQSIAPYKHPRAIEFLAALPRTSTGKVQRYLLRDLAASAAEAS